MDVTAKSVEWHILFCAGVMALAGIFYGFDLAVMSGAILSIRADFGLTSSAEEWVVSAVLLGAIAGVVAGGAAADRCGRRTVLIVVAITAVAGGAIAALAPSVPWIFAGRVVQGAALGMASVCGPLYMAEISPARSRGLLVSYYALGLQSGVLLGYLTNLAFAAGGHWRWMFAIGAVPALLLGAGMRFLPESPRWLLARRYRERAIAALRRLRGDVDVDRELQQIERSLEETPARWSDLFGPAVRFALLLGIGLAAIRQATGVTFTLFYAPTIFRTAGLHPDSADILATVILGLTYVAGTVLAMVLVDRIGRRPLLLGGLAGMAASIGGLGVAIALMPASETLGIVAVGCLTICALSFAAGPGAVVFVLIAEIYPLRLRARAMSVALLAMWVSFWVNAQVFLSLVDVLGTAGSMWLYAAIGATSWVFVYVLAPETKGRALEEI